MVQIIAINGNLIGTVKMILITSCFRLQGSCNHIAALLFRIEYAVRAGLTKPTSTSTLCMWNIPAGKRTMLKATKVCDMIWKRDHYGKELKGLNIICICQ